MKDYKAPWSTSLVAVSGIATVILLGAAVATAMTGHLAATVMALLILAGAVPFTITGYNVTPEAVGIRRLFWTTRLPLAGLQSADYDPGAMSSSIRLFGNGGLFSFTGLYRNRTLGLYRSYVMDPRRAVVLRFPRRTIVISPDSPREFVDALSANLALT